jgi:hypothetical protein
MSLPERPSRLRGVLVAGRYSSVRKLVALAVAAGVLLGSASCSLLAGAPTGSPTPSSSSPAPVSVTTIAPKPKPSNAPAPVFVPAGTASANLPYFTDVIERTVVADPTVLSHQVAKSLVAAGFTQGVEYTYSTTAVGLTSDSVSIAALFGGECLIAQYGPAVPTLHTLVMPALAQGGCLIGSQVQRLN